MKRNIFSILISVLLLISFKLSAEPTTELLALYPNTNSVGSTAYLYVDTEGKQLSELKWVVYNNPYQLTQVEEIDLLAWADNNDFSSNKIIPFSYDITDEQVCRVKFVFSDNNETSFSHYFDNTSKYVYLTDIQQGRVTQTSTPISGQTGYGTLRVNVSVENGTLNVADRTYKYGYGVHANGWLKCEVSAGKYNRFKVDVGKQKSKPYNIAFKLRMNGEEKASSGVIDESQRIEWDYELANNTTSLKIDVLLGDNQNWADHGSIGAPRLYLTSTTKQSQTISWNNTEEKVESFIALEVPLNATSTSGLTPYYRVVKGSEYAKIKDGNKLDIFNIPDSEEIWVEAQQPGNLTFSKAEPVICKYTVKRKVVKKNEKVTFSNNERINKLIVYADKQSSGQILVPTGIVSVDNFVLKYTFKPNEWSFITFPTSVNLDKISNFNELGYTIGNGSSSGAGFYFVRKFVTSRGITPNETPAWRYLSNPNVVKYKGYLMGINDFNGTDPVEVTFEFNNVEFDKESTLKTLNFTMDFSQTTPNSVGNVYITPKNVKGNTLKVITKYQPNGASPIDFAIALKHSRVGYTTDRKAIRFTLPDQTPAKVVLYNKDLSKVIKAVWYVAPSKIDISDLDKGEYKAVIQYGNALDIKEVEVK